MENAKVVRTWWMLRITYALVPIVVGFDKCVTGLIVDWAQYASPLIMGYLPLSLASFLMTHGIIEIAAGVIVWVRPKFGGYLVAAWVGLVIINLLTMHMYFDIIARDAVIAVGALALAWLSDAK